MTMKQEDNPITGTPQETTASSSDAVLQEKNDQREHTLPGVGSEKHQASEDFPDIYTRLHALTKADNLGLGLVVAGSILMCKEWTVGVKLLLIWLAVLVASTISCYLISNAAHKRKINPWKVP